MYLSPHPYLDCLSPSSQPPGVTIRPKLSTFRPKNGHRTGVKVNGNRREMSICIVLGMMLGRSIQTLYVDIKKKMETKQQKKREQQQLSEQSHGSARFWHSGGGEYQHLGGHEHQGEELSRNPDGRNNPCARPQLQRVVAPRQTLNRQGTEVVNPLEDIPPIYDHSAPRLPPYDHTLSNSARVLPCRGRRHHRRSHDEILGGQANTRVCTGIRIRDCPALDVDQGAVIWYDALEDQYEVISRSLAPPTDPPLPPPYMPNMM